MDDPLGGVLFELGSLLGESAVEHAILGLLEGLLTILCAPCVHLDADPADDGGEVAVARLSVTATGPLAHPSLGFEDVIDPVAPEGLDEADLGRGHLVLGVDALEGEPTASVLGPSPLSASLREGGEDLGIGRGSLSGGAGREVDGEEGGEQKLCETGGQGLASKRRDLLGEPVGEPSEGIEGLLDRPEGPLQGSLRRGVGLFLGGVSELEIFVGLARLGGEVGGSLIGEDLCAGTGLESFGHDPHDGFGVFLGCDLEAFPESDVSDSGILQGDDLEGNVEELPVGGVGDRLDAGGNDVQSESAPFDWARRHRRIGHNERGCLRGPSGPRAEGALGQSEGLTEGTPVDPLFLGDPCLGGDEPILKSTGSHPESSRDVGRHGQKRLGGLEPRGDLVGGLGSGTTSSSSPCDERLDRLEQTRLEPAGDLGTDVEIPAQIGDGPGEPGSVEGRDDRGGEQCKHGSWTDGRFLRGSGGGHGVRVPSARVCYDSRGYRPRPLSRFLLYL